MTLDPNDLLATVSRSIAESTGLAIEFNGTEWSWDDVRTVHAALRDLLDEEVPDRRSGIAIAVRNRPAHIAALWSLASQGRPAVFINVFRPASAVAQEIAQLRPDAVLADETDWASPELASVVAEHGLFGIALGTTPENAARPFLRGRRERICTNVAFAGLAVDMLTSGTSGAPKRIPMRPEALGFAVHGRQGGLSRLMGETPPGQGLQSALIQYAPTVHLSGLFTSLQAGMEGRPLMLLEKFDVESWRRAVRMTRPSMLGLPPAQMRMVLDADVPGDDLASVVGIRCGNAMLDDRTRTEFENRYGIPPLSIYGATEYYGPIASWSLEDYRRYGAAKRSSVGRIWTDIASVRIVDPETGEALPPAATGRLETLVPSVGADWITTHDLAQVDADGFLYLEGRADDAINRGGFKIIPTVVADALRQHPAVSDVIVLGVADRRLGEVPVAAVQRRPGLPAPDPEELRDFVRQRLSAYHVPARILVLDVLPRTVGMKISRPDTAALFT